MKNDTETRFALGGNYMREILERNRARGCAIGSSIDSPTGDDLVENPPGEITGRLEARRRYLQDLR